MPKSPSVALVDSSGDRRYIVVNQTPNYLCSDILTAFAQKRPDLRLELWHGLPPCAKIHVPRGVLTRVGPVYNSSSLATKLWSWALFTHWASTKIRLYDNENTQYLFFSNPPTLAFLHSVRSLYFNYAIYDLYPDALLRLRLPFVRNLAVAIWECHNRAFFSRAQRIFVISEQMAKRARSYLPPTQCEKVMCVSLWARGATHRFDRSLAATLRKNWGLEKKRVILYSGNLGASQPVEAIVETARQLATKSDWMLVIVGGGSHARLVERQTRPFSNVFFRHPVPDEQLGALLGIADWGLVLLSEASGNTSVPSKTYNLLSAGVPLLAMVPEASETARLIDEDRVGLRWSMENMTEVLNAATSMLKADRDAYSQRALETAKRYTSVLAEEFVPPLPEDEGRPRGTGPAATPHSTSLGRR